MMDTIRLDLRLEGNLFEEDGFWVAELPQLDLCEIGETQKETLHSLCDRIKVLIPGTISIAIGKDDKFSVFCVWRQEVLDAILHRISVMQKQLEEYRSNLSDLL